MIEAVREKSGWGKSGLRAMVRLGGAGAGVGAAGEKSAGAGEHGTSAGSATGEGAKRADRGGLVAVSLPAGPRSGLGFACYYCHLGYFAEVVKATVDEQGSVRVDKVWVVADVGSPIINPSGALNQVQGSVLDGLGQALGLAINIEGGQATATNFHEFPLLRMYQAPPIEVHFLPTAFPPTGLGEPALPPVLPALANAVFRGYGDPGAPAADQSGGIKDRLNRQILRVYDAFLCILEELNDESFSRRGRRSDGPRKSPRRWEITASTWSAHTRGRTPWIVLSRIGIRRLCWTGCFPVD